MESHNRRPRPRPRRRIGIKVLTLGDGRHVARWRCPLSGAQKQQSLDALGLRTDAARRHWVEAKAAEVGKLRAAVASGQAAQTEMSIADAVAEWAAARETSSTQAYYARIGGDFAAWCSDRGARECSGITAPLLAAWRDAIARAPSSARAPKGESPRRRAASSSNLRVAVVRILLNWMRRRGLLPKVDTDGVRTALPSLRVPRREIAFLRPGEVRSLLEAALRHDRARPGEAIAPFMATVLLSGGRFEEVAGLRWREIDLGAGEIRLPPERTKTRAGRVVRLDTTPTLAMLLRGLAVRRAGRGEGVFEGLTRSRAEWARALLVREYGAPRFSWHGLRRTSGTVIANAPGIAGSASLWAAAKRLGHSVVVSERAYAGLLPDLPRDATTVEDALGIRDLCEQIVAASGGGVVTDAQGADSTHSAAQSTG